MVLARQRGRQNLAVHAEGEVAAGDLLQLRGERVVEQEADAERAEDLGVRQADGDRHRHELQHAVRLRQQAELSRPASASRPPAGARRSGRRAVTRRRWRARRRPCW